MSGHSKWSTIKRKKGAKDAKRGKLFSKLGKAISVAARQGNDPGSNYQLKVAIEQARNEGLPKENIERAIRKGSGEEKDGALEKRVYEGMAPEGIQVIIDAVTDNGNRTTSELRKLLERKGGKLATPNSISWNFDSKGHISLPAGTISEDELFELVVEAGAESLDQVGDSFEIYCSPEDLEGIRSAMEGHNLKPSVCEVTRVPKTTVRLEDEATVRKIFSLFEDLDEHDDVQSVNSNLDLPDEMVKNFT